MDDGKLLRSALAWVLIPYIRTNFCVPLSELELDLQLNQSWGRVTSKTCTNNAGRWLFRIKDLTKRRVGTVIIGKAEIGVIEDVEKLKAEPQHSIFPMRDFRSLCDCKVRVEIAGSTKAIPALRERHQGTIAYTSLAQMSGIELGLAAGLEEKRVWIGR